MGLLQDIIQGAMDGSKSASELLRSVKVLAVRSGAADLADWVTKERDGYGIDNEIPPYRGPFPAAVLCTMTLGPQYRTGQTLASTMFPDEFAPLFQIRFRQPVAELENLVLPDQPMPQSPWPGTAVHRANMLIHQGNASLDPYVELINVYRQLDHTRIIGILDAVRNKILDLALELEQVAPDFDDNGQHRDNRERVSAVYQTVVHSGGQAYIGQNETVTRYDIQVTPGDVESLRRYLDGIRGPSEQDKAELIEAVQAAKEAGPQAIEKDSRLKAAMKKFGGFAAKTGQEATSLAVKALLQQWLGPGA